MSTNSINFKVNDVGVSSFMEKIKQKSSELTSQMIQDAQKQTNSAKEQLRLVEEKIKTLERASKIESQGAQEYLRKNAQDRVVTSQARIGALEDKNLERYKSGEISPDEFRARKKKINQLKDEYSEEKILSGAEEQIEQLKEQARQSQLLSSLMKEVLNTIKTTSREEVNAVKSGDKDLQELLEDTSDPTKKLSNQLAKEQLDKKGKDKSPEDNKSQWLEFAKALMFERVGGMVAQIPTAQNELDFVKPMMAMTGLISGGLIGNLIDMVNVKFLGTGLGNTNFGGLGQQFGEKMGEFAGSALERTYRSREELTTSNFKLKALGAGKIGDVEAFMPKDEEGRQLAGRGLINTLNQNLTDLGMTFQEVSKLQYDLVTRQGSVNNLEKLTKDVVGLDSGWGVRNESSMAMLDLVRSSKSSDSNIQSIIGGILQKGTQSGIFQGGDRSYLNEFLTRNFIQLQKQLLQTQSTVASGTTFDILSKFNSFGGEWGVKDSRSGGLINTLQSSLSNPSSDSMKALSYYVMRKNNPGMSLADTGIEIQKGLGSPAYLQSMMKYLTSMGGDESYQTYNVASAFGLQGNLAAAKKLLNGYKSNKLGSKFDISNLEGTGEYSESSMLELAKNQQGIVTSTSEIENAYIESAVKGIEVMSGKIVGLFDNMITELEKYIIDRIHEKVTSPSSNKKGELSPKENTTWYNNQSIKDVSHSPKF